jgi:copper chaperone CopZ
MKNIIVIFITVFLFGINNNLNAQSESMDEFTVQVDGLGCPFCAYGLEKKFKELKGIKNVKIEMETGIMDFAYPTEKSLTIVQVEKQVEKAGYTPVSVLIKRANGSVEKSEEANNNASDLVSGELTDIQFFVAGNCDMCKSRIEKAAKKVEGVQSAIWNKETKELMVRTVSDVAKSTLQTAVAEAGHDTKNVKASMDTYDNLPGCCQYERVQ